MISSQKGTLSFSRLQLVQRSDYLSLSLIFFYPFLIFRLISAIDSRARHETTPTPLPSSSSSSSSSSSDNHHARIARIPPRFLFHEHLTGNRQEKFPGAQKREMKMKREQRESSSSSSSRSNVYAPPLPTMASSNIGAKPKIPDPDECQASDANGMDELLAALGYKVRASDMAEVAHKLEQLEMALCNVPEDGISQLASETVHYNPSDLSNWLETMLTELNAPDLSIASNPQFAVDLPESSTVTTVDFPNRDARERDSARSGAWFEGERFSALGEGEIRNGTGGGGRGREIQRARRGR